MSSIPVVDYASITAIGSFAALDASDSDYLAIDPDRCSGGFDPPLRVTEDQAPVQDGVLVFPPLDDANILTIVGDIFCNSVGASSESGYRAAVRTLLSSLKTALDAGKASAIDVVHSEGTMKVWKHAPIEPTWQSFHMCSVTFSVVEDVFA